MIALTLGVWVAALGSAGALTYHLSRPLPSADATPGMAAPANLGHGLIAEQVSELSPVLYIPTITVVGQRPHRAVVTPEKNAATDISHMRCEEWRELDMGSGQVEVCN
jgi:hypothetical protein